MIDTGVYTAWIVSASVAGPAPAAEITYTVAVNTPDGRVEFDGVSPHPSKRWTNFMPVGPNGEIPELYPFPDGSPVLLHVVAESENKTRMWIGEGEVPAFGGCPE